MASRKFLKALSKECLYDTTNLLLGDYLGSGSTRSVFVNDLNPQLVVKVARDDYTGRHANIIEWETWKLLEEIESPLKDYFAGCHYLSPQGHLLIMERTEQPTKYPDWIPKLFCDTKLTNFGCLKDGRFVCHDYGQMNFEQGMDFRFVRPHWWQLNAIPRPVPEATKGTALSVI